MNSTFKPSQRKILYSPPSTISVIFWSTALLLVMTYFIYSIEQSVTVDHTKRFTGKGLTVTTGGRLFDPDFSKAQIPAEAQRWF